MEREFSTPLTELPTFLSTISMVEDDGRQIVESLTQAERKSPSVYEPTRDLFCLVLQGDLCVTQAMVQAHRILDEVERKCAVDVLEASKSFLEKQAAARVGPFPAMNFEIPNGLSLNVAPVWLRHFNPPRLMILHFWRQPLSDWQLGAASAVLRAALLTHQPDYAMCEIDFISVPHPEASPRRRFEHYDWAKLRPLDNKNLHRFWKQFCGAWSVYQNQEPREIKRRRSADLFGRR